MAMLEWMDLELLAFIERYAGQRAQWHVTAYVGSHPQTALSLDDIATHTGLSKTAVTVALTELVALGLLELCPDEGAQAYRLTADSRLRALAQRFARQSAILARLLDLSPAMPDISV